MVMDMPAVIEGLVQAKATTALPEILAIANPEKAGSTTLAAAAHAIEQFGARDQIPWLCSVLTNQDRNVRAAATHALGFFLIRQFGASGQGAGVWR